MATEQSPVIEEMSATAIKSTIRPIKKMTILGAAFVGDDSPPIRT